MSDQLSLLLASPSPSDGLPPAVLEILHAARSIAFSTRIARGAWGIGLGQKRKWVLTGACCCPIAALLIVKGAEARENERSPTCAAARVLGISELAVNQFIRGFDGGSPDGTSWYAYGARVFLEFRE